MAVTEENLGAIHHCPFFVVFLWITVRAALGDDPFILFVLLHDPVTHAGAGPSSSDGAALSGGISEHSGSILFTGCVSLSE